MDGTASLNINMDWVHNWGIVRLISWLKEEQLFFFFDRQKLVLRSAKKMGAHPMHTSSVHKKTTQAPEKKEET